LVQTAKLSKQLNHSYTDHVFLCGNVVTFLNSINFEQKVGRLCV